MKVNIICRCHSKEQRRSCVGSLMLLTLTLDIIKYVTSQRNWAFSTMLIVAIVLVLAMPSPAQDNYPVTFTIRSNIATRPGEAFRVPVTFQTQQSWYIYAPTGNNAAQGMVETKVVFASLHGITRVGRLQLPELAYQNAHEVYLGDNITVAQIFKADKSLKAGEYELKGQVTYQACSNDVCLPPVTKGFAIKIEVK